MGACFKETKGFPQLSSNNSKMRRIKQESNSMPIYKEQDIHNQVILQGEPLYQVRTDQLSMDFHPKIAAITIPKGETINFAYGSGVLLSRNIVLTAAHNLYYKKYSQNNVIDGQQGNKTRSKIYLQGNGKKYFQVEDWRYLQQFTTALKKDETHTDYALIKLKSTQGLQLNHFQKISLPCQCVLSQKDFLTLNIYGYPKDKQNERKYLNYEPLNKQGDKIKLFQYGRTKKNSIRSIEGSKILYLISTYFGQSGSPIIIGQKIIGIHTAGVENQYNFGRLVTKDFIENITKWCKQLKGDKFMVNQSGQCSNCKKKEFEELTISNEPADFEKLKQSATHHSNKGHAYWSQHKYSQALQSYQQALKIFEKVKGKGCLQSANTLNNIGNVYFTKLQYDNALYYYDLAIKIKKQTDLRTANTLKNIALVHDSLQDYKSALDYYSMALKIQESLKGKGCYQSARTLLGIGNVYQDQQKYSQAIQYYTQSLLIFEKLMGKGCLQSSDSFNNIGSAYWNQQKYTIALNNYMRALEIKETAMGKRCQQSASVLFNIGKTYLGLNNYILAAEYFQSSRAIYEEYNRNILARDCAIQEVKCLQRINNHEKMRAIIAQYELQANEI